MRGQRGLFAWVALFVLVLPTLSTLLLAAYGSYIGYTLTIVIAIVFAALLISALLSIRDIVSALATTVDRRSAVLLGVTVLILFVVATRSFAPAEFLFPDDDRYQAIAMNILNNLNSDLCFYGTGHVGTCFIGQPYYDTPGWPFIIAVSFWLFGTGNQTIYALELLLAVIAVLGVFALASVATGRRGIGIAAAIIFVLTPEFLLWSRVLANANVPFMTFATLAVLFFVLFMKRPSVKTLSLFTFGMLTTIYMRTEGVVLAAVLLLYYAVVNRDRLAGVLTGTLRAPGREDLGRYALYAALIGAAIILVEPDLYLVQLTAPTVAGIAATSYANQTGQIVSLSNFMHNIGTNAYFLLGGLNGYGYPYMFTAALTVLAAMGAVYALLRRKTMGHLNLVSMVLLCYFAFYTSFFPDLALTTGVRYLLVLYPFMAVLAAMGLYWLAERIAAVAKRGRPSRRRLVSITGVVYALAVLALFAVPLSLVAGNIAEPQSLTYNGYQQTFYHLVSNNQTESVRGVTYLVYENYSAVPSNCLVFSNNPWIWYEMNRTAAYLAYLNSSAVGRVGTGYACYVADVQYGCPFSQAPFLNTICGRIVTSEKPIDGLYGFLYNVTGLERNISR